MLMLVDSAESLLIKVADGLCRLAISGVRCSTRTAGTRTHRLDAGRVIDLS